MFWFWLSVISILILTGLAIFWAVRLRKRRLERKLRLEITNDGNVQSHFQLRAEELGGQLEFRFTQGGIRLPEVLELNPAAPAVGLPVGRPTPPGPAGSGLTSAQKAQKTMSLSYAVASLLTSIGAILPRSLGAPLIQAGSQLNRGQAQASRIQQVSSQAATLTSPTRGGSQLASAPSQPQPGGGQALGLAWVETPAVEPGQMLIVDLLVRSAWLAGDIIRSFQIKSRATEGGQGRMMVEDGQVEIRGGFWSHRFYPMLLILALAIAAILLAVWLARINGLPV
jgi:hypothetical protein